jgi:hypothetical protein
LLVLCPKQKANSLSTDEGEPQLTSFHKNQI